MISRTTKVLDCRCLYQTFCDLGSWPDIAFERCRIPSMKPCQLVYSQSHHPDVERKKSTHETIPDVYSSFGSIGLPFSSTAFETSKVASIQATAIQTDARAMNRPGHIRRPKPNACSGNLILGSRKCSGLKFLASGKTDSSWSIALL